MLEVEDSRVLVISKYALDWKQYNTESVDVTWESCTLRKWLNSYFFDSAFTYNEKAMIPTVRVVTARNPACSTNPGNATQDKVFLLSIEEANRYFTSADERQCKSADDAYAGMSDDNSDLNCWWWLRSPGVQQDFAALVDSDGCICTGDYDSDDYTTTDLIIMSIIDSFSVSDENYVRPALWIDLSE